MEKKEVKNVLKTILNQYDLSLVSRTLGVPERKLYELKKQFEEEEKQRRKQETKRQQKQDEIKEKREDEKERSYFSMQKMRQKYISLYLGRNTELGTSLSYKEIEKVEAEELDIKSEIAQIEEIITKISNYTMKKQNESVKDIYEKINLILEYPLTLEQYNQLAKLTNKLMNLNLQKNYILLSTLRSKINKKIDEIQRQRAIQRIRDDIPESIENIITQLSEGTIKIEEAKKVINKEAEKRIKNKPRNKFSLSEEQEKRQILMQIKIVMRDKAKKYKIKNPELTINKMSELFGVDLETSVMAVIDNLIERQEFEKADEIFKNFIKTHEKNSQMSSIERKIKNAKFSNLVLKALKSQNTKEEDIAYFNIIKREVEREKIKFVSLGKSKDGLRDITLEDIWDTEKTK